MAASIHVKCWGCGKSVDVSPKFAGKKGKCPVCGKVINIPNPNEVVEHAFDVNVDVSSHEVKKVARAIAQGPGMRDVKKKGFLSRLFSRK